MILNNWSLPPFLKILRGQNRMMCDACCLLTSLTGESEGSIRERCKRYEKLNTGLSVTPQEDKCASKIK